MSLCKMADACTQRWWYSGGTVQASLQECSRCCCELDLHYSAPLQDIIMMRFLLFCTLLMSLGANKGCCQKGSQLPVPQKVMVKADLPSQMLSVTWENDLHSIAQHYDIQVLRVELLEVVHNASIFLLADAAVAVHQWNWTSDTPLECTSLSVQIRSRIGQQTSEWSSPEIIRGMDIPENTGGQMFPQDKVMAVGTKTTFCCIIGEGRKFGAIKNNLSVLATTRLSRRTYASIRINDFPSASSGTNVICIYDDNTLAAGAVLFVGYPPDIRNLLCETQDLVSVECHWVLGQNTYLMGLRRTFFTLNDRECLDANKPGSMELKCKLSMTLDKGETKFTLRAKNPLGQVELTDTADLKNRIRPLAPELSVEQEAKNARLQWHWTVQQYEILALLCEVQLSYGGRIRTLNYTGQGLAQVLLEDLQPYEEYSTQVRCGAEQNFWRWGSWSSELRFRTKEDRPDPVDIWVHMTSELTGYVLWKPLSKSQSHGVIQGYNVILRNLTGGHPQELIPNGSEYSASFSLESLDSDHVVTVTAHNAAGISPDANITIPRFQPDDGESLPEVLGSGSGFDLSWPQSANASCGYVVVWTCASGEQNGQLDWVNVPAGNNSVKIESGIFKAGVKYNLSIYACTPRAPKLLERRHGYLEEQAPIAAVTSLKASQEGSDILLYWNSVPLEGQRGFIRGYTVYIYSGSHPKLLENITDPSVRNLTVTQLSFDTYKFIVKPYTSAGEGPGLTVAIRLEPVADMLIMEILIALGTVTALFILVTAVCYRKREWVKRTFYPDIPEPKLPEWSPTQVFGSRTLDVKPCPSSSVHIVENSGRKLGKEELEVVLEDPQEEDVSADTDSDELASLRYYNQVVGEPTVQAPQASESSSSSSSSMCSTRTDVTYTGIQTSSVADSSSCSSIAAPVQMETPLSGGYRPQMNPAASQVQPQNDPSDVLLLESCKGYQPQASWKLYSTEDASLDSLGSPTSVNSSQFLLPDSSQEEDKGHTTSTTWFRSLLSGKP
ncbi:hypothetical protein GN956_G761 [Arapaima gigas]